MDKIKMYFEAGMYKLGNMMFSRCIELSPRTRIECLMKGSTAQKQRNEVARTECVVDVISTWTVKFCIYILKSLLLLYSQSIYYFE